MNDEERKAFWETLKEAKSIDDYNKIQEKIVYPKNGKLYRYRSVNIRTLNALAESELYFSTSNYYDDPFDTFIRINKQVIRNSANLIETKNLPPEYKPLLDSLPKNVDMTKTVNAAISFSKEMRNEIRKRLWSICFTERPDNENLWLKYADRHQGFTLEYDINSINSLEITISNPCPIITKSTNFSLYPMCYSNDSYDATEYAGFFSLCYLLEKMNSPLFKILLEMSNNGYLAWETEKILLIKKWLHHYDEEWRMILNNKYRIANEEKPRIICKPSKIILGLRISDDDRKAVLMAAEKAGINDIEQMIIDDNDEFVAEKLKI